MPLELMYITNSEEQATRAEDAGVDRIFVDLETKGKVERQGHLDTVISHHSAEDVKKVKRVLKRSQLLTRVNPIHEGSGREIDAVIDYGADIIMLPMFTTKAEVETFVEHVGKRAKTCLLLETPQALVRLDDICSVPGVDEIHVGLNDLHLGMRLSFMFELLSGGIVDYVAEKVKRHNLSFGFGGIARIGEGVLPAESILAEHVRLGSKRVILSRSFHRDLNKNNQLRLEVTKLRDKEREIQGWTAAQFTHNKVWLQNQVKGMA